MQKVGRSEPQRTGSVGGSAVTRSDLCSDDGQWGSQDRDLRQESHPDRRGAVLRLQVGQQNFDPNGFIPTKTRISDLHVARKSSSKRNIILYRNKTHFQHRATNWENINKPEFPQQAQSNTISTTFQIKSLNSPLSSGTSIAALKNNFIYKV